MSDANNQFMVDTPTGPLTLELLRHPAQSKQNLQAWEAADIYLLNTVLAQEISGKLLIVNDSFGALTCALHHKSPSSLSDSWLAQNACRQNLSLNQLDGDNIDLRHSLDWPEHKIDWALIKIPKSLALLEDQLQRLRPLLRADSQIIAAAMSKHIHTSTLQLFERIIGPTKTSLAVKKSRLVFSTFNPELQPPAPKYPSQYTIEHLQLEMQDHSGVFSQGKLDIGSRFFCEHLPASKNNKTIVDLGCGNGLIGVMAGQKNPNSNLIFCDESHMAIASAQLNWSNNGQQDARFITGDGLDALADNSVDQVLNNPPFHQGNVVGDFIAREMFKGAHRVLKPGGELWVVGNRHLGYQTILKKLFGYCEIVSGNKKFVILKSKKN